MNPYTILAAVLLGAAALFGADHFGHSRGVDQQKAEDQKIFDQVNAERVAQKAAANSILQAKLTEIIALQAERATLLTKLETEHAANQKATNDLRAKFAGERLRFQSAKDAGNRADGSDPMPAQGDAADNASPAECVLSAEATERLRGIAYDADTLRDDYKMLYDWAHGVK